MGKKTMVLGASLKPQRVSHQAIHRLVGQGHEVVAVGLRKGQVAGVPILTDPPALEDLDTLTLYLNASNQRKFYEYIEDLNPRRIIFNPGAENPELFQKWKDKGKEAVNACTMVMLAVGSY